MPVNQQYYYQDEDIDALRKSNNPDVTWAPAIPMEAIGALKDEFINLESGKKLLLPLNENGHWIGAMVERETNGELSITWLDSMNPKQKIPLATKEAFEEALGVVLIPKNKKDVIHQQKDASSCGPWMIENLRTASGLTSKEGYNKTTEENIRQSHINELGEVFAEKQLHNNALENIDPTKLEAFKGTEPEKKAMQNLATKIQDTTPKEFQDALSTLQSVSPPGHKNFEKNWGDIQRNFQDQKDVTLEINSSIRKPEYLISLNENIKLQEHSAENSRASSRASSRSNSIDLPPTSIINNDHYDLNAPTKELAEIIHKNASPQLKDALESFVAVAPALTKEEREDQWKEMKRYFNKENAKDGDVFTKMESQGFDHRNVDSLELVNKYVEGYKKAETMRSKYEATSIAPPSPITISSGKTAEKTSAHR